MVAAVPVPAAAAQKPLKDQWYFESWGIDNLIWPMTRGRGVTVAVIDSGVQADLPDFGDAVLPGVDIDAGTGDGRTDTSPKGHGTQMASLIAAQGHGSGMLRIAPDAKILPIVATDYPQIAQGIRYAADNGAQVISVSQAGPVECLTDMQAAVSYAVERDALVVAGAGNDGESLNPSHTPANCAGVLAVGAGPWSADRRSPAVHCRS